PAPPPHPCRAVCSGRSSLGHGWTTRFPPLTVFSTVLVPSQLLENRSEFPFQSVMATESLEPGSPLSVIVICSVRFPPSDTGAEGFVTSERLAFDVKFASPAQVGLAGPGLHEAGDHVIPSWFVALVFIW